MNFQSKVRQRIGFMVNAKRLALARDSSGAPFNHYEECICYDGHLTVYDCKSKSQGKERRNIKPVHIARVNLKNSFSANANGTISARLPFDYDIDLTVDGSILVINDLHNTVLSLSSCGTKTALFHPSGKVYQYGNHIEIVNKSSYENFKCVKMYHDGVSIAAESHNNAAYFVEATVTNAICDTFMDLKGDSFTHEVFYTGSHTGPHYVPEAKSLINRLKYWRSNGGTQYYKIGNIRISQALDGRIQIVRDEYKYTLKLSSTIAEIITDTFKCCASQNHLFVQFEQMSMYRDYSQLVVLNGENVFECC